MEEHAPVGGRTSIGSNTAIKRATPRHIRIGRADWIVCTAHWFLEEQSLFPDTLWQGVEPLMTLGVSISKTEIS
jgi:hypothetical protein